MRVGSRGFWRKTGGMQDRPEPPTGFFGLAEAATTARVLALEIDAMDASNPDGFELVFKAAVDKGANSVAAFASPFFNFNRNIGPS